jgi:hypothetical protein
MNLVINLCKRKLTRMETDRMKKIFFPSCESIAPITKLEVFVFKTKRFGRVYMNQEWGSHEKNFKN